jgi:phosphate transport system substrate-binding protein
MLAQKSGLQRSTIRNIALAWVLTLPAAMLLAGGLFLLFRAMIPDAHAATTTPTVRFDPSSEEGAVVPISVQPLRMHGSNTIGADLAPALAEGLLHKLGATNVTRSKDTAGHAWVVSGQIPGQSQPAEIDIDAAGSATAFEDLARGACDLGMASRIVTDAEADAIAQAGHGDLRSADSENVIGLDGIAVIVNAQNPLRSMTTEEVARIFSGETKTWPAASGGAPITVVARDDKSGTFDTFKTMVLGARALSPAARRIADSDELAAAVAADPNAIGFVSMSHVGRASPVALSEGGAAAIVPSRFSVATEDYPLSRRLYLYAPPGGANPLAAQLAAFAQSPVGQTVVAASGFVDLAASSKDADACTQCPPAYVALTRGAQRLSLNFRFRVGSTDLDSRGQRDVARVASVVRGTRRAQIELLGFSDNQGTADANLALSRERAKRVAERLDAYGVHAEVVDGLGSDMPVASNDTPAGRERNRRVEVWIKLQQQ